MNIKKKKQMHSTYSTGYVTMTGDTPHEGHFNMLKLAKSYCSTLIIGLTTDEVAKTEKRPVLMKFKQRKTIFENCKWVDFVLPHNGESKLQAWERLQFDVCFTCAEEYFDNADFNELRKETDVKIIGIPRTRSISSSQLLYEYMECLLSQSKMLAHGVSGSLLHFHNLVFKPLVFSSVDTQGLADNFSFFQLRENTEGNDFRLPRNFKHLTDSKITYPLIAGISPCREIAINRFFSHFPFSVFHSVFGECETNTPKDVEAPIDSENLETFAHRVYQTRIRHVHVAWLVTKYAGVTLDRFAKTCTNATVFRSIYNRVLAIIDVIREHGVIHGDIHPGNVVVNDSLQISIIDWGWCSATFFPMSNLESEWLQSRLKENFDALHFIGACQYNPDCAPFLSQ
jgi:cytidyltransferase-like protein